MVADIVQQTRDNFHSALLQAGDLSRQSAQVEQDPSVPDSAHKLNGCVSLPFTTVIALNFSS
jgi:hypothetical protein